MKYVKLIINVLGTVLSRLHLSSIKSDTQKPGNRYASQVPLSKLNYYRSSAQSKNRNFERPKVVKYTSSFKYLKRVPEIIFLLIIGVCLFGFFVLSSEVRVVLVGKEDGHMDTSKYFDAAKRSFGTSFRNRFKLFVQPENIEADLLAGYPEIKDVSVDIPFFNRSPEISLELYGVLASFENSNLVLLDSGVVVRTTNRGEIDKKVLKIEDRSGLELKEGSAIFTDKQVDFIKRFSKQADALGVEIEKLIIPSTIFEVDVKVAGEGYIVKLNIEGNADQQMGAYQAIIKNSDIKPSEYIDIRAEDKLFYR